MAEAVEEHFVLRVKPPALAAKLRGWLREQQGLDGRAELLFEDSNRRGALVVEGVAYPVTLEDLPARVESFKTLDDANLVKIGDVGQVLIVHEPGTELPPPPPASDRGAAEAADGVTPPMRRARARQFRPRLTVRRDSVFKYEGCLLEIMHGRAPEGWSFTDVEEEYRVDPVTGEGRWVPVAGSRRPAGRPAYDESGGGGGGGPGGGKRKKKKKGGSEDEFDFDDGDFSD
ncbi:transcription initiation factor TFIID subunit 7-like [Raphidocelis subcapitata]|uniref:Transcription initiation factor TFIID subunit 7-like n=1 Tax=Raphidocelis subcapitata TaxID=307507 RepID=A0A2V0P669_9CHLO|nr:transcription initiation factor TFIID subunit 7-like [Raphidocelis subcapitata]|eukprot:GBF92677.1 transcription initiation factor TFIID subunit 7-like [Raphidocelis subcapitata]